MRVSTVLQVLTALDDLAASFEEQTAPFLILQGGKDQFHDPLFARSVPHPPTHPPTHLPPAWSRPPPSPPPNTHTHSPPTCLPNPHTNPPNHPPTHLPSELYRRAKSLDKAIKLYADKGHCLLGGGGGGRGGEDGVQKVYDDIVGWLEERCVGQEVGGGVGEGGGGGGGGGALRQEEEEEDLEVVHRP